jgi:protein-S-isoprenylcysteine O-methyltransferase Ste14
MVSLLGKTVILALVAVLLVLGPMAAIGINDALGWPRWQLPAGRLIGGSMVACAFGAWSHCSSIFARLGKGTPFINDPPKRLVTGGLYRYSRNPLYVAHVVFLLGWYVAFGRLALLLYAAGVAALFGGVAVLREEPALRAHFGEDYVRYTRMVPRWFPLGLPRGKETDSE